MEYNVCTIVSCPNNGKYCRTHLQPKEPKQSKIRKQSEKRKEDLKIYHLKRQAYLQAHPVCEFEGCNQKARDLHHKAGRSGDKFLDETKYMALCREHHTLITINSAWAIQNGYSESRLSNENK